MQSTSANQNSKSFLRLESISQFERGSIELFVSVAQVFGLQRSVAQIYGLLFASPEPLSFTDIVLKLQISKGSASQGLHILRSVGAVRTIRRDDERREFFEPELALRNLIGGLLRDRIEPIIADGACRVELLRSSAWSLNDPVVRKLSLKRVKQLEAWRRQMWLLLPVLKTFLTGAKR